MSSSNCCFLTCIQISQEAGQVVWHSHLFMANRETMEKVTDFIFWGSKITADGDCSHEIKTLTPWKKSYDQPRQHIKKQRHYFAKKGPSNQGYDFSSHHVWMWELDYKYSWAPKNWCFWAVVLEKTLESPLDCKEIKPVNPKRNKLEVLPSLEGLMLKLKLQYFSYLLDHQKSKRVPEKTSTSALMTMPKPLCGSQ